MTEEILHKLQERIKELTALHRTARVLQDQSRPPSDVIADIVALLPPAWQYPEITVARISYQHWQAATPQFRRTEWRQGAEFRTRDGAAGLIEIIYLEPRPASDEGPFMREERDLIDSLAEMLRSYFQHLLADAALQAAHDNLERLVGDRTEELKRTNAALQSQINELLAAEQRIEIYQGQLRQLASELSLTEARERRVIAEDLHDHIGQALAFIKMNVSQFQGDAMFCGFEGKISDIMTLLDQTIQYTRNLTFEISPPILYELGLDSALEWLAGRFEKKHGIHVTIRKRQNSGTLSDDVKVALFKSVQELLTNAVKHAVAKVVTVTISTDSELCLIEVADNGRGFDTSILDHGAERHERFGLFSIRERLNYLGGRMTAQSKPGEGTRITLEVPRQPKESAGEDTSSARR